MEPLVATTPEFTVYFVSEYAVTLDFGGEADEEILRRISTFDALLRSRPFDGFLSTVPAYTTLSIFFDPMEVIRSSGLHGISCFERVSNYVHRLRDVEAAAYAHQPKAVIIPVCYGGAFGPDLEDVARHTGLSADEVIRLHSTATYRVHLIGFTPGFAYLGGMPEQLAPPRKSTPRHAVAAGSVGIAGKQTGIYPLDTPGGWQIIGRTPLPLFDVRKANPTLLTAGDHVMFRPIPHTQFESLHSSDAHPYR